MVEPVFAQIKNSLRAGRLYERRGWISDRPPDALPEPGLADTRFRLSLREGAVDREQPKRGESGRPGCGYRRGESRRTNTATATTKPQRTRVASTLMPAHRYPHPRLGRETEGGVRGS
jgi:hypothetical protein